MSAIEHHGAQTILTAQARSRFSDDIRRPPIWIVVSDHFIVSGRVDPDGDYRLPPARLTAASPENAQRGGAMKPRMNFYQAAPETIKALSAVETQIVASGLEKSLIELVKTRASQINGCAFCINMHTQDARKLGETEQRLYLLSAWRESPLYTDRERAALAWTDAVTLIADTHAPDDVYEEMRAHFSEAEAVNLTMLIGAINAWNRIAISFRAIHPVKAKAAAA
jgi:AhpD family alkylhydroperoxidase